jgi:hypothetical protein
LDEIASLKIVLNNKKTESFGKFMRLIINDYLSYF